jgi:hypothetical protein
MVVSHKSCVEEMGESYTLSHSALHVYLEYSMKLEVSKLILISQRTKFYYQSLIENQILTSIIMTRSDVSKRMHKWSSTIRNVQ